MKENTVEFCSATASFSKAMKKHGNKAFTIDIDSHWKPNIVIDVRLFRIDLLPNKFVDRAWFSPPCTKFSVAAMYRNWKNGKPINKETEEAIEIVKACIRIKDELLKINPDMKWYIENPRGMLRKQGFMKGQGIRHTICYCQYGDTSMKPTDIWTNDLDWIPRKMCNNGSACHNSARRGSDTGTQGKGGGGKYGWVERTRIPSDLFKDILKNRDSKIVQLSLKEVLIR